MNLVWIDHAIILLYLIGTLWLGLWISRRASKDLNSYFLGGKTKSRQPAINLITTAVHQHDWVLGG